MDAQETIDIDELIDILDVEEIGKSLSYAIQEYKSGRYSEKIQLLEARKKVFRQTTFESRQQEKKEGEEPQPVLYWFDLVKYNRKEWKIRRLEPSPPPYYNLSEILPEDVIEQIGQTPANLEKIERLTEFSSQIYSKSFDVQYIRYSPYHAQGTIRESLKSQKKRFSINQFTPNEEWDAAYKALFYYMEKFPGIKGHMFKEFFKLLQPLMSKEFDFSTITKPTE